MSNPELDDLASRLHEAYLGGGWLAAARLTEAIRDAREKAIVDRVEGYLEDLIESRGEPNPLLSVRDVRRRLFEVPQ
jgi:hypothetical protein